MLTLYIFAVLIGLLAINVPVVASIGLTSVIFFAVLGQGNFLAMLPPQDVLRHLRASPCWPFPSSSSPATS